MVLLLRKTRSAEQEKKKKKGACQCRGHGFDPWSGKIPDASGQLILCPATTEPKGPRARTRQQEKPRQWEAHSPQLEKAHPQQWRPSTAKNKEINKINFKKRERRTSTDFCWVDTSSFFKCYLFIYWLCCCCWAGFSPVVASGGYSLVAVPGRLIAVVSPAVVHGF